VYPEEAWGKIIAINLSAAFHTTKAVLPMMYAFRFADMPVGQPANQHYKPNRR
jgi:NAD(P)-dependent dehydrogenase (short-subunit alcohol dehydrogenase family)